MFSSYGWIPPARHYSWERCSMSETWSISATPSTLPTRIWSVSRTVRKREGECLKILHDIIDNSP